MQQVDAAKVNPSEGIVGDRYNGKNGKRHITLLQAEHLAVISSCMGTQSIMPDQLRRNIVVKNINLLALKGKVIYVGEVQLQVTGLCHPCSRMEEVLGPGGYNAVRGHGGITARILDAGVIHVNDGVRYCPDESTPVLA